MKRGTDGTYASSIYASSILCGSGSFRQGTEIVDCPSSGHAEFLSRVAITGALPDFTPFETDDPAHFANLLGSWISGSVFFRCAATRTAAIPPIAGDTVSTAVAGGEHGLNHGGSFNSGKLGPKKSPCRANFARRGLHSLLENFPSRETQLSSHQIINSQVRFKCQILFLIFLNQQLASALHGSPVESWGQRRLHAGLVRSSAAWPRNSVHRKMHIGKFLTFTGSDSNVTSWCGP